MAAKFAQLTGLLAGRAFNRRTPSRQACMMGSLSAMPWSERRSGGCGWARATMPGILAAMMPAPMTQPCNITFRREIVMADLLAFWEAKFNQKEGIDVRYHFNDRCITL